MREDNTSIIKKSLNASKKYSRINKLIMGYIRALCDLLNVKFSDVISERENVTTHSDNENESNLTENHSNISNEKFEELYSYLVDYIKNNYSDSNLLSIDLHDEFINEITSKEISISFGSIFNFFSIFKHIYNYSSVAIEKTKRIDDEVKPFFESMFAYPFAHFVYDKNGQIYLWETMHYCLPEKLDLSFYLKIKRIDINKDFSNALHKLLKEYNRILAIDEHEIREKFITIDLSNSQFSIYKYQQKEIEKNIVTDVLDAIKAQNEFSEETMQKVYENINSLKIYELEKIFKKINGFQYIIGVAHKITNKISDSQYKIPGAYIEIFKLLYGKPANEFFNSFLPEHTSIDCHNFTYNIDSSQNSLIPIILGLSPIKQKIFESCSYNKKFIPFCYTLIQLKHACFNYKGNIVFENPFDNSPPIIRTYDYSQPLDLLNNLLFQIMKHKGYIPDNDNNTPYKRCYTDSEKNALAKIYDCIYDWIKKEPCTIIEELPKRYKVIELDYFYETSIITALDKQIIIDFVSFITNENPTILKCLIYIQIHF